MYRFEINISHRGLHWALVKLSADTTQLEAVGKARTLDQGLRKMHPEDQFIVTLMRWTCEVGTQLEVW